MRSLICLIALASVTACASTPTAYQPMAGGDRGYSEMRIEQDRYRIRFAAGSDASFQLAEDYALRRAAEITLRDGGDWFLVVGIGLRFDGSAGEKEVMLEIVVRSGERPQDPQAYDARAILDFAPR